MTSHMCIALCTHKVWAQGVKSLGDNNNAGIVMPFSLYPNEEMVQALFVKYFLKKIGKNSWLCFIFATDFGAMWCCLVHCKIFR